jgi:hypothetical protein
MKNEDRDYQSEVRISGSLAVRSDGLVIGAVVKRSAGWVMAHRARRSTVSHGPNARAAVRAELNMMPNERTWGSVIVGPSETARECR